MTEIDDRREKIKREGDEEEEGRIQSDVLVDGWKFGTVFRVMGRGCTQ